MKRFLSWLLLIFSHFLLVLFLCVADELYYTLKHLGELLSFPLRQIVKVINWGLVSPLIFSPILIYSPLIIGLCDKLSHSKKGTRYLVFGIIMLLLYLQSFLILLFNGDFNHIQAILCITYLMLIIQHKTKCE